MGQILTKFAQGAAVGAIIAGAYKMLLRLWPWLFPRPAQSRPRPGISESKYKYDIPSRVGKDCLFKRATLKDEPNTFGVVAEDDFLSKDRIAFTSDHGRVTLVDTSRVKLLAQLNKRTWLASWANRYVEGNTDPMTPRGKYPVFVSRKCVTPEFGKVLEEEQKVLRSHFVWENYHGEAEEGEESTWVPPEEQDEKTKVLVLYGVESSDTKNCLPFQNPCDPRSHYQFSRPDDRLEEPFIKMPPVTGLLRELMVEGNPSLSAAFEKRQMGQFMYAVAAITHYSHKNSVGSALAWHYDKSLGIETACVSVPKNGKGEKTIGLGGRSATKGGCGDNCEDFDTMTIPVNSYWGCNAKAIYHAVGNNDQESATIVYRTLVPRNRYKKGDWFMDGCADITTALKPISVRYFPVLEEVDVAAAKDKLQVYAERLNQKESARK